MDELQKTLPQLRYLFYYVKKLKRAAYIRYSNVSLVNTLWQCALNLVFSNKNNLKLTKGQIRLLQRHRVGLNRLIDANTTKDRKRLLTNDIIDVILAVFLSWISKEKL